MNATKFIAAIALIGSIFAGTAFAEDKALIAGYAGADIKTGYNSRGKQLTDDFAFQPYAGLSIGGFDMNLWIHNDLENDEENEMEEVDYEASYSGDIGDLSYTIGGVIWAYANCDNDYRLFAKLSYKNLAITPSINAIYQLENSDGTEGGTYAAFKLAKDFALCEKLSLGLSALIGVADEDWRLSNWGVEDAGFVDAQADLSLSYSVTDQLSIAAGCTYVTIVDNDIRDTEADTQADGKSDHVIGYVGAFVSF